MGFKLQSAMEYLMTYGWAILIIAVVIGAMYQLGVFGPGTTSGASSCLATSGFLCKNPILNSSGSLAVIFGQIGSSSLSITAVACTKNSTPPSSTTSVNVTATSGQNYVIPFQCALSTNSISSPFQGYLWIIYNKAGQSGLIERFAVVTTKVSTFGSSTQTIHQGGSATTTTTTTSTSTLTTSIAQYFDCIGAYSSGYQNKVYYAPLYSGGVGTWTTSNNYPLAVEAPSCVSDSGYVYCEGGFNGGPIANSYYAPLQVGGGVGSWSSTTAYPITNEFNSCVSSSGYMYCVGGYNGAADVNSVYYAPISSSGIGSWVATNSYPTTTESNRCITSSGYIFCMAGSGTTPVYYAQILGSGGVGGWSSTTSYPGGFDRMGCSVIGGYIYCVGTPGQGTTVYSATISGSGIGTWTATNSYPTGIYLETCMASSGVMYCGPAFSTTVASSPVSNGAATSWQTTNSYPLNGWGVSCVPS